MPDHLTSRGVAFGQSLHLRNGAILTGLVFQLAPPLFQTLDIVTPNRWMKLLGERFIEIVNTNQLDDVTEIFVSPRCQLELHKRAQIYEGGAFDHLADRRRIWKCKRAGTTTPGKCSCHDDIKRDLGERIEEASRTT